MLVPRIGRTARADAMREATEFDEAHTAFDETPREEGLACVRGFLRDRGIDTVEFLGGVAFAGDVAEFGNGALHPKRGFVIADGGFDLGIGRGLGEERLVELTGKIETPFLRGDRISRADVADGFRLVGFHDRALMPPRQKSVAEQTDAAMWRNGAARLEDDVAGKVLIGGAETIRGPRASAGVAHDREAGVHEEIGLRMLVQRCGHRADHAEFVRAFGNFGEHAADRHAAFSGRRKLERAGHDVAVIVEHRPLNFDRHRLAMQRLQEGLRIKRIDVRNAAGHETENHVFGFRRVMRFLQRRALGQIAGICSGSFAEQSSKRDRSEAGRAGAEHVAPGDVVEMCAVTFHRRKPSSDRRSFDIDKFFKRKHRPSDVGPNGFVAHAVG